MTDKPSFFYDLGSPYAWLAAERVDDLFRSDVEWVPVLLPSIVIGENVFWGDDQLERAAGAEP